MIRFFDILISFLSLIIFTPLLIVIALPLFFTTKGNIFYTQRRVGQNNRDFTLYKFRTMYTGADKTGFLTVGDKDQRITPLGYFLRKYKLDELPQLFNVLIGDMSLVGPRPEVRKYVNLYTPEQKKVLNVRPGITDYASIKYVNENQILAQSANPEKFYLQEIMPLKLNLNLHYIENRSVKEYFKIIGLTIKSIL